MRTVPFAWLHAHAATHKGTAIRLRGESGVFLSSCLSPAGGFVATIDHHGTRHTVHVDPDEPVEVDPRGNAPDYLG